VSVLLQCALAAEAPGGRGELFDQDSFLACICRGKNKNLTSKHIRAKRGIQHAQGRLVHRTASQWWVPLRRDRCFSVNL